MSTYVIWCVPHDAGWTWQKGRTWCKSGTIRRKRKGVTVEVTDPETEGRKNLIERAYKLGETLGLSVWTEDEAGPFQTIPYEGLSWRPKAQPKRQPHKYVSNGTAKLLTLLHPSDRQVRVKGVTSCRNTVLHPWLQQQLSGILADQPAPAQDLDAKTNRALWESWCEGLDNPPPLPDDLPPLRMLLVLDNLAGHKTPSLVNWLMEHGIMPPYTPLGGSWLNMTKSIQRILNGADWRDTILPSQARSSPGWKPSPADGT